MSRGSFDANAVSAAFAGPLAGGAANLLGRGDDLQLLLGLAAFVARALDQLALAVAQLLGEAFANHIDRVIELVAVILGVDIGPGRAR